VADGDDAVVASLGGFYCAAFFEGDAHWFFEENVEAFVQACDGGAYVVAVGGGDDYGVAGRRAGDEGLPVGIDSVGGDVVLLDCEVAMFAAWVGDGDDLGCGVVVEEGGEHFSAVAYA